MARKSGARPNLTMPKVAACRRDRLFWVGQPFVHVFLSAKVKGVVDTAFAKRFAHRALVLGIYQPPRERSGNLMHWDTLVERRQSQAKLVHVVTIYSIILYSILLATYVLGGLHDMYRHVVHVDEALRKVCYIITTLT